MLVFGRGGGDGRDEDLVLEHVRKGSKVFHVLVCNPPFHVICLEAMEYAIVLNLSYGIS